MDQEDKKEAEEYFAQIQAVLKDSGLEVIQIEEDQLPNAIPPEKAIEAYSMVKEYFGSMDKLARAAMAFEDLLPKKQNKKPLFTEKYLKNDFFGFPDIDRVYRLQETLSPIGVALISLQEFFDSKRFLIFDPRKLPAYKKLGVPLQYEEPIWIPVSLGPNKFTVPDQREIWIHDNLTGKRFVVNYGVMMGGSLKIQIESAWEHSGYNQTLLSDIKNAIITSKYFRGQILELAPRGFTILDLAEQHMPIIDKALQAELEKNVINLFKKAEHFKAYGLPTKRAIILEGAPGNGKTLLCRYLAHCLKGQTTVLWITSKAIDSASDIQTIFEMARKLSPVLVIMEDIDLMAGTRHSDHECLGEMLNQLDGISQNEALVLVATTNVVKALDIALRDRPGRFDRIFQIGKPSADSAEQIAKRYLKSRNVGDSVIESLTYSPIMKGDLTGAQIVEVVKGGLFEAIHRGCDLNDICLTVSYNGLTNQRKTFGDDDE